MRSASATAWRTACSHWARSTTAPAFTPCDWIWPYPINSTAWLRPRKASLGARIPARLAAKIRGLGRRAHLRIAGEQREEIPGAGFGTPPDNQRQRKKAARDVGLEHRAIIRDHRQPAIPLPQRKRRTLDNVDLELAGIELQHRRFADPGI